MKFAHVVAALALILPACGKEPVGKYNVVLISIDSLRADRTGPYGHRPEFASGTSVTPNLDRLAADGITFEDAWTTSSWTLPAHVALMTGLDDRVHQVDSDVFMIDPLRSTLAERFQSDGYATGGAYSGPYLDPKYGLGRGFDEYRSGMTTPAEFEEMVKAEDRKRRASGQPPMAPGLVMQMRDRLSHFDMTSARVNSFAREFLGKHSDERFLLFLHYFDAHYDYLPERGDPSLPQRFDPEYRGTYHGENWFFDSERVMSWPSPQRPWGERLIGERDLSHALALYDAEIHWVDRHVGEVLDLIAAQELEDETIVIVTSDHGDEFFEHGSIAHRSTLHAELLHIPLIVRVPGAGQSGQRVPHLVRITDVAPSLLDWCGLPPLSEARGASVRPLVENGEGDGRTSLHRIYFEFNRDRIGPPNAREAWRDERFAVIRHLIPEQVDETQRAAAGGIRLLPWNDPRSGKPYLVFDRVADPREQRPLPAEDPRYAEAIRGYREAFLAAERAATAMKHSPLALRLCAALTEDQQRALSALGYAGSTPMDPAKAPVLLPFPEPVLPR